ncbi:MAG: DUF2721 domain-containing protein [Ignavibacteria bacterium]|nr:MAG: DUF2721 domain-containing protein [Ignavibacteria bacterium]
MHELTTPLAQQTIQAILTPALMISACGLLLLGLNNRYAIVVSRIRLLNDEKRRKLADPEGIDREYIDALRFESVMRQIPSLLTRANYLRRSLLCLWIGVICYVLSSILLGAGLFLGMNVANLAVWIFLFGLLSAVCGVVFALLDIYLAYRVLKLEVEIY